MKNDPSVDRGRNGDWRHLLRRHVWWVILPLAAGLALAGWGAAQADGPGLQHIAVSFFILLLGLLTILWGLEGIATGAMRLRRKRVTRLANPLTFWSSVGTILGLGGVLVLASLWGLIFGPPGSTP